MRVSFIIPLYNCLPLTQAMFDSLGRTLPSDLEHEIIFVDDGSTDGTREWLRSLPQVGITTRLNAQNFGYAKSNNRGASVARGDFLLLLNNDVVLTPRWLEPMLALAERTPSSLVGNVQRSVHTGLIDHAGMFINAKAKPEHDRRPLPWFARARASVAATGACLLVPRALWNELGGFDEGFVNGGEDVDFCLRARARGAATLIALKSVIGHHVSASPGRKARDEENSRRLALRWRNELAELGARAWCQDYVARQMSAATAFATPASTLRIFAHAMGFTRRPPSTAIAGVHLAIDRELARWNALLGPAASAPN